MTLQVRRILETCLYVDELDAAERFYVGVPGLPLPLVAVFRGPRPQAPDV